MKKIQYLIFGLILLSFGSCQKEEETIIQQDAQSFLKTSTIAGLLSRTSQNPTSKDNILDNSSCFSVTLPVTVTVDSQQVVVSNDSGYQAVQDIIDAYSNDDDKVSFMYPITITYKNFQTQVLNNYNDLHHVLENCPEDDGFDEIDCLTLVYPIQINLYDSNNQIANSVTVTSNTSMFNFLANLNNTTYVGISYPIAAVNSTGQTVVLNSNTELLNIIENSIDDCDDDSSSVDEETSFIQVLVNGSWNVSYCYYEGEDTTSYYLGYNFTFNANNSALAIKNSTSTNGQWDIHTEDTYLRLDLNFDGSNLHDIETNWRVIEHSQTIIKLKKQESNGTDYLTFSKN